MAIGVTLLQVGSCGSALLHDTLVDGDGHGLFIALLVKIMGEKEGVSLAAFSHTQWGNTHKGGG